MKADNDKLNIITIDKSKDTFTLNNESNILVSFLELMSKSIVHEILQKDEGIKSKHNDCWSNLNVFERLENHTLIKNDSDNKIFPFLTENDSKRYILPSTFGIRFNYMDHENASFQLINLKGSKQNIDLQNYELKEHDEFLINYKDGHIKIKINDNEVDNFSFKIEQDRGYISWKLPENSFVKFRNFELFTESDVIDKYFTNTNNLDIINQNYENALSQIKQLKSQLNTFETRANDLFESNNFLFNTLFLDYDLKSKGLLYITQKLCTELLSFVGNVAKKYDIEWWLDYGNLLGSIRHQYFIPWDDDVDIGMMRNEYNQYNKVIKNEITDLGLDDILRVSYRKRKIDDGKVNSFLQIFDMHWTEYSGNTIFAGVDVFPYDYLAKYEEEGFEDKYYNSKINLYRFLRKGTDIKSVYMGLEDETALKNYYEEMELNISEDKYIIPGVEGACGPHNLYKLNVLEKEDVFPLREVQYGDVTFYAPNNYDKHLRGIYGEYMTVPDVIRTHSRVKRFRYDENAMNIFNEDFKRLQEVNESFKFE